MILAQLGNGIRNAVIYWFASACVMNFVEHVSGSVRPRLDLQVNGLYPDHTASEQCRC